jgi:hypothetical protein
LSVLTRLGDIHHSTPSQCETTLYDEHGRFDLESSGSVGSSEDRNGLDSTEWDVEEGTVLGGEPETLDKSWTKGVCPMSQL